MFKNMKLGTKIGVGFGIIILIAATLGFVGWNGVSNMRNYMAGYAKWGNIDMVMNEGVTQNVLRMVNAMSVYRSNPNEDNFKKLQNSLGEAENGIGEWQEIIKGNIKCDCAK